VKKIISLVTLLVVATGAAGCDDDGGTGPSAETFIATLNGANESPSNGSPATGSAVLTVNSDRTISWTMDLQGIRNMTMSHIHGPAAPGTNAPVRADLFIPPTTIAGPISGRAATGTFGEANVVGISYDSLLVLIRNGNAYVNIHTNDGVAPANTGPGDFPPGEIRGQIVPAP
jgi:hypothetical protein